jgi:hypothetical protein
MNANINTPGGHDERKKQYEIAKRKEDLEIKVDRSQVMESFKDLVGPSFVLCKLIIK